MTSFTPVPQGARPAPYGEHPLPLGGPVVEGPRWFRTRIRLYGPLLALVPPAIVGAIAIASLRLFESALSGAVGLVGGVMAAPALLVAGAPFGDRDVYPLAVAASALVWVLLGFLAARRSTRYPLATWHDFWRHYAWLCGGVWVGCWAALGIAAWSVSDALV